MAQGAKTKSLVEVVGAFAVIASLVFVGLEVRQSAVATRGATQQALTDAGREASNALVADSAISELTVRFLETDDWSTFTAAERLQITLLVTNIMRVFESAHYQWTEGNLAPEIWAGWELSARDMASSAGMEKFWNSRRLFFHEAFRTFFEADNPGGRPG